jgi:hypothetical protein
VTPKVGRNKCRRFIPGAAWPQVLCGRRQKLGYPVPDRVLVIAGTALEGAGQDIFLIRFGCMKGEGFFLGKATGTNQKFEEKRLHGE